MCAFDDGIGLETCLIKSKSSYESSFDEPKSAKVSMNFDLMSTRIYIYCNFDATKLGTKPCVVKVVFIFLCLVNNAYNYICINPNIWQF